MCDWGRECDITVAVYLYMWLFKYSKPAGHMRMRLMRAFQSQLHIYDEW